MTIGVVAHTNFLPANTASAPNQFVDRRSRHIAYTFFGYLHRRQKIFRFIQQRLNKKLQSVCAEVTEIIFHLFIKNFFVVFDLAFKFFRTFLQVGRRLIVAKNFFKFGFALLEVSNLVVAFVNLSGNDFAFIGGCLYSVQSFLSTSVAG